MYVSANSLVGTLLRGTQATTYMRCRRHGVLSKKLPWEELRGGPA